jgi:hypothetical protein
MVNEFTRADITAEINDIIRETYDRDPQLPRQQANVQLNALSSLIPMYDGNTNPGHCRAWMIKMEVVFTLVHLKGDETDEFKINYASLRLKGAAEQWYNAKRKVLVTGAWKQFKRALIERFDPSLKFLDMQLTSLRQDPEESFEDYYTRFGSLMETVFEEDDATRRMAQLAFVQG